MDEEPTKLFLSWCHDDARAKNDLLSRLEPNLKILRGVNLAWWQDSQLLAGEAWRSRIITRLSECDMGLQLLSPAFFASDFISRYEVPPFVGSLGKPVMPIGLRPFPLDGSRKLASLDDKEIFLQNGRSYSELSSVARDRFAVDLASQIRDRVLGVTSWRAL